MANLLERAYNPDILNCLANLSNDEVFTPPELANRMLDLLPAEIWQSRDVKILDPCCKTGVFLREAAKRLIEAQMPGYQERADAIEKMRAAGVSLAAEDEAYLEELQQVLEHVFKHQLYGIAISELTSLMTRRSLYCSKYPESKYSIVKFDDPKGNIDYKIMNHMWKNGKCAYCGAREEAYKRNSALESYAYEFIHLDDPNEVFNMQFDVIVGNPPYQIGDGGAQQSATPLYNRFIEQAKVLNPRFLSMIVPARWYSGGRNLDDFRENMLGDKRIRVLHDFPETNDVFQGINVRGGICYFLWDRDYCGDCDVVSHLNGNVSESRRSLDENGTDLFIRYNTGVEIIRKVQSYNEPSFSAFVSASKPFGLRGYFNDYEPKSSNVANIKLYRKGDSGFIRREQVLKNKAWIDQWKIVIPEASPGGDEYPHLVLSVPILSEPGSVCTETYLVIGPFENEEVCKNVASYIKTKFFRFLVLMIKNTQHTTKKVYKFVPVQDFGMPWTDNALYDKYGLSQDEREFIDLLVKER